MRQIRNPKIDFEAIQGEIAQLALGEKQSAIDIQMVVSTGFVTHAQLIIRGLEKGNYRVTARKFARTLASSGELRLTLPISQAQRIRVRKV